MFNDDGQGNNMLLQAYFVYIVKSTGTVSAQPQNIIYKISIYVYIRYENTIWKHWHCYNSQVTLADCLVLKSFRFGVHNSVFQLYGKYEAAESQKSHNQTINAKANGISVRPVRCMT